ncbi:unnamed protein product [Lactuca virosa]|uniref:Uncharacterized protein n=1 Tax=Lactuca virosa TaxID=75947 RepID=A0AAU9NJ04_9ASTR|nr:unnamed protein product [Lactuca virosa]
MSPFFPITVSLNRSQLTLSLFHSSSDGHFGLHLFHRLFKVLLCSSPKSTFIIIFSRLTLLFLELRSDVWGFICAEGNGEGKQLHGKEKQQQGEIEAKFLLAFILKVSDDFNMIPPLLRLEIRKLFAQWFRNEESTYQW